MPKACRVRCKYCGQGPFRWGNTDEHGWRLFTPIGALHTCERGGVLPPVEQQYDGVPYTVVAGPFNDQGLPI